MLKDGTRRFSIFNPLDTVTVLPVLMFRRLLKIRPFFQKPSREALKASVPPFVAFGSAVILTTGAFAYYLFNDAHYEIFPATSTTKLNAIPPIQYGDASEVIDILRKTLGKDKVTVSKSELEFHSDSGWASDHAYAHERPLAIVYPESTEDVAAILRLCHQKHVPIVPYTGGTSLEGHFIPTKGGVTVDMGRMDKIVTLHEQDLDVVVQAGVGWEALRDYLADFNLMFGPDPGPGACIGGMCATSCSGTNAARYGTMRENVVSLTVVLADGTIVKTKRRPRKSAAGYNLTNLIIGSEGTLGIVTEVTLKLHVTPKYENVALVSFPTLRDAATSVASIVREGVQLNAIELLDDKMMHFVNQSTETINYYDELPTLLMKIGGTSPTVVDELTQTVESICKLNNNKTFAFAKDQEEKNQLWNARKVALWSTIQYGKDNIDRNINVWSTDVAVPISNFVEALEKTKKDISQAGLVSSIVGHAGDGNFHALILYKDNQREIAANLVKNMVDMAIQLDGTVTGEHGIGVGKKEFLVQELGEDAIGLMRKIKFALDPHSILNPDKVFAIDPHNDRSI